MIIVGKRKNKYIKVDKVNAAYLSNYRAYQSSPAGPVTWPRSPKSPLTFAELAKSLSARSSPALPTITDEREPESPKFLVTDVVLPSPPLVRVPEQLSHAGNLGTAKPIPPPASGFPRVWELFPIILPRAVRERIYEPAHEELKEDYLREKCRWNSRGARFWVNLSFTIRTGMLFLQSLWANAGGVGRKAIIGFIVFLFSERALKAVRGLYVELFGRLP